LHYKSFFCFNLANEKGLELMFHRSSLNFAILFLLANVFFFTKIQAESPALVCENIDYSQAVHRLLIHSNLLKASEFGVEVKEASEYQMGLMHNPIFSIEYDNGDKDDKAELTYVLTQTFELGGKHSLEKQIATIETYTAMWNHEITKLDLLLTFTHAFIDAAAAQEKLKLALEQSRLAEQSLNCVQERSSQGKTSALDQKKSKIQYSCKSIAKAKAQQILEIAKKKIALMWGISQPNFKEVNFPFYNTPPLPIFQELETCLSSSPEFSKVQLERWAAEAITELERANRYPDLEVSAGVSTERTHRSPSFFVELSLPLPIFEQNQGNISSAIFREWQAVHLEENFIAELKSNLFSSYREWQIAFEESEALKEIVHSSVEENVEGTREGYESGKFDKLDLLEVQRASLEVKDQYIDALAEYHHKKAETLRLVGNSQWTN
jgi:outer membrane protein, heavy metal efflux system